MEKNPVTEMLNEGGPATPPAPKDKEQTVIVTGSSGLIGYQLCKTLAATYNVIGFDRPGAPHPPEDADRMDVDVTSDVDLKQAFENVRRDYGDTIASVIHLAAYYDFSGKPSTKYDEITVRGTERLLRALRGFQVEQFIFSSTMLVHAPTQPGHPITEDSPLHPKWDYPLSKVKTENVIRRDRGPIPTVMLRIAGVYNDEGHSIPLSQQIERIYKRSITSRVFPGDLSHGQPFIHEDDLIDLLNALIEKRKELPSDLTLLAGEEETLSYETLQHELGRLIHGKPWKTFRIPKPLAKVGAWLQDVLPFFGDPFIKPWMIDLADDHIEIDITRAKKYAGWQPKRSLRQSLPEMVESFKKDHAKSK